MLCNGYVKVKVANVKYRLEHVFIAETALGRPLPDGAKVHHVDEDKTHNENSNLVICQNQAYHLLLHYRARILAAGGNPNVHLFCYVCKRPKMPEAFHRSRNTVSGRAAICKDCSCAQKRAKYESEKAA